MKDPKKAKHILKEKASLLQMNDDKFFGKKLRSHIENTDQGKKKVFTSPPSKKPLRTAHPSNQNNPCGGGRFYYG